jgi:hypothetical protein
MYIKEYYYPVCWIYIAKETGCHGWVIITTVSYSGGVPVWNLSLGTSYPDWSFVWFFLVPTGKCRDSTLNYATDASFHILSSLLFTYYLFIWCYIVWVTEKVSLNKLKINKQIAKEITYSVTGICYILSAGSVLTLNHVTSALNTKCNLFFANYFV